MSDVTAAAPALDAAATIFGVQPEVLAGPLISRFAFIRGESINSPMDRGKVRPPPRGRTRNGSARRRAKLTAEAPHTARVGRRLRPGH